MDAKLYGWEPVHAYHAVWLQQLENHRVRWSDTKTKLEFCCGLVGTPRPLPSTSHQLPWHPPLGLPLHPPVSLLWPQCQLPFPQNPAPELVPCTTKSAAQSYIFDHTVQC